MRRDKQTEIEEMARVMNKANGLDDTPAWYNDFLPDAEALYNAGYRKAPEVAREIFDALEEYILLEWNEEAYAELKKKYESEKDNGEV